jgi:tetratricopeptide (TPR) repeat protein
MRQRVVVLFALLVALVAFPPGGRAATGSALQPLWDSYRATVDSAAEPGAVTAAARAVAEAAHNTHTEQFPAWSLVMLRDAEALLKRGEGETAIELARIAASLSRELPAPHVWLATTLLAGPSPDALASAREWLAATQASFRDFWSFLYRIDRWLAAGVLSVLSAAILIMALFLIRVIPLLAHLFVEWSGHQIFRPTAWILATWVVILSLAGVRWSAWLVLVPGAVAWWFLSRRERLVLGAVAGLGVVASFLIPQALPLLTADQSAEFRLVVDVAEGRDATAALADAAIVDSPGGASARATALVRTGRTDEAVMLFQEALVRWPNDARLLNGYGNSLFRRKDYAEAISVYQRALAAAPQSVPVLYNLSQAYRADLRFDEGEAQYQKARALNAGLLERYGEFSRRGEDFLVVEYPTTSSELLTESVKPWPFSPVVEAAVGKVTRHMAPTATIGVLLLFGACWGLGRWYPNQVASPCEACGGAICRRCQRYFVDLKLCTACWKSYAKGAKLAPRATLPQVLRRWEVRRRIGAGLAMIPGAGHLLIGRPFWGVILALTGSWLIWVGILQDLGWKTTDARVIPAPWYTTWGPIVLGVILIGLLAARHILGLNWTPAASPLPDARR